MTVAKLEFLKNDGGESEGLSDAGIETFRENPFAAVAREIGQNSKDAVANQDKPVRITFDLLEIPASEFPSIEEYRKVVSLCHKKSCQNKKDKEIEFFKNARNVLSNKTIRILKISDYNTTGVKGPCTEGNPFHTLAKSDGVSDKVNMGSLGSFGIGKNAPFALSDLQTVFYSTLYYESETEERPKTLCIGKTQFISHLDNNKIERRRKGYWGNATNFTPIENQNKIPKWLRRELQGTSIFSIAMRESENWELEIIVAILINFFVAVHRNEMEFEINNKDKLVNKDTINALFNDKNINKVVDRLNLHEVFNKARNLYNCLIAKKSFEILSIDGLGKFRIYLNISKDIGYNIGIIRSGMFITDNLKYFDEPFKRFPHCDNFSAIIEPNGYEESEKLRRIENPRHDNFSADRISDPNHREMLKKKMKELAKEVREFLKNGTKLSISDHQELSELDKFFETNRLPYGKERGSITKVGFNEVKNIEKISTAFEEFNGSSNLDDDDDKEDNDNVFPKDPAISNGGKQSNQSGNRSVEGASSLGKETVHLDNQRVILSDVQASKNRQIFFTPTKSGEMTLKILNVGLSKVEKLIPVESYPGKVVSGNIVLNCKKNRRVELLVEFKYDYEGPVGLFASQDIENQES